MVRQGLLQCLVRFKLKLLVVVCIKQGCQVKLCYVSSKSIRRICKNGDECDVCSKNKESADSYRCKNATKLVGNDENDVDVCLDCYHERKSH